MADDEFDDFFVSGDETFSQTDNARMRDSEGLNEDMVEYDDEYGDDVYFSGDDAQEGDDRVVDRRELHVHGAGMDRELVLNLPASMVDRLKNWEQEEGIAANLQTQGQGNGLVGTEGLVVREKKKWTKKVVEPKRTNPNLLSGFERKTALALHKLHVECVLLRLEQRSRLGDNLLLQGLLLSLLPEKYHRPVAGWTADTVAGLLHWFVSFFALDRTQPLAICCPNFSG